MAKERAEAKVHFLGHPAEVIINACDVIDPVGFGELVRCEWPRTNIKETHFGDTFSANKCNSSLTH
jgi:hypothetical protein